MVNLRLPRLPDRTPVKLGIQISPQLNTDLLNYAALYKEAYGIEEAIIDLIPSMLSAFLDGDRSFQTWAKGRAGR